MKEAAFILKIGTLRAKATEVPPQEVPEKCALLSAVLPEIEVLREARFKRKTECLPNTKTL